MGVDEMEGKMYHLLSEMERLAKGNDRIIGDISKLKIEINNDMSDIKLEISQLQTMLQEQLNG